MLIVFTIINLINLFVMGVFLGGYLESRKRLKMLKKMEKESSEILKGFLHRIHDHNDDEEEQKTIFTS